MYIRTVFIAIVCCLGSMPAAAQSYRSAVNEGNERYKQEQFDQAKELYEQAAAAEPERAESHFNYGNAAYRTDEIKKALEQYERAGTRLRVREQIASTLYNAGNTFLKAAEEGKENPVLQQAAGGQADDLRMQGYHQAIEMYKKALKLNPADEDARYNLTYARKKLEELQNQQQNQDQDQNEDQQQKQEKQDKEQDQDQDQKDESKQEEQQKKDQQDQQQQQQQNQKDPQQQEQEKAEPDEQQQSKPEQEQKISKQQAEQILRALERQEKALQKEKRRKVGVSTSVEKDW